jgi:chemotaxis protein CheY-P-specific phosphatase CheC
MLTEFELEITKEIINISLANSADAFSRMAMETVEIGEFMVEPIDKEQLLESVGTLKESMVVLTTEVKGNLKGKSYLIFNNEDLLNVIRIFSKQEIDALEGGLTEFQKAILLELDNIVSAAMVTQLSNILEIFIYGDVPHLHILTNEDPKTLFNPDIERYTVGLKVHAKFKTVGSHIAPSFVWLFKDDFIVAIQDLIKRKKHLALVKSR